MTHGPGTLTGRTPVTVKVLPSGLVTLNVFALTCRTTEAEAIPPAHTWTTADGLDSHGW